MAMVSSTSFWPWILPFGAVQFFLGASAASTGVMKAAAVPPMNVAQMTRARILIVFLKVSGWTAMSRRLAASPEVSLTRS